MRISKILGWVYIFIQFLLNVYSVTLPIHNYSLLVWDFFVCLVFWVSVKYRNLISLYVLLLPTIHNKVALNILYTYIRSITIMFQPSNLLGETQKKKESQFYLSIFLFTVFSSFLMLHDSYFNNLISFKECLFSQF